ncbi:hypothetical protein NECAME_01639 [Necator americanus]|uniref:Uncharacterized protein n=1 Tax=Necator americanus TaxID=51031 RepID=W2TRJ1_NECAM|nr:hypothetical protein NECAME_01639 [Necator americanus]ETN84413.1 hypothetical protein NECAME_01639 [Necator americanus]
MPIQMPKPQSQHRHHRVDALWDNNADKYRVACRSVHVMRATQFIGYGQLLVIGLFTITLLFFYGKQLNGGLPADHWLANAGGRYITSLLTAVSLQLSLVAEQIGEQLQATSLAFAYEYTQPPPYADTIEKSPLTIA